MMETLCFSLQQLNNLRGQQNLTQWGTKNKVQGVETPDIKLNMAVKEAQMKSLSMNGVKSLGNQQSQVKSSLMELYTFSDSLHCMCLMPLT